MTPPAVPFPAVLRRPMRSKLGRFLLAASALAALVLAIRLATAPAGADRDPQPVPLPWSTFPLDLPPDSVRWSPSGGDPDFQPVDLGAPIEPGTSLRSYRASVQRLACGGDTRRTLFQRAGSEVLFAGVLGDPGELRFGVAFQAAAEAAPTYHLEVLARAGATDTRLWEARFVPPPTPEERHWREVEVELPELPRSDLVLRMRIEGTGDPHSQAFPGWGFPVLSGPRRTFLPARANHRSVVLFLVDTLRADHVGYEGHERPTTPRIDAVASEGLAFLSAQSVAPWTKPSVASLLTSRYPIQHGAEDFAHRLGDGEVTLGHVFRAAGYRTAAIGDNGWIFEPQFGFGSGFDDFIHVADRPLTKVTRSDAIVDEAVGWLDRNYERPFFLYVHTVDPHAPYLPPESRAKLFVDPDYDGVLDGSIGGPTGFVQKGLGEVTPAELAHLRQLYDAEISFNDAQIGRLVDRMKALGVWDTSVFAVTADHGEAFLEHGIWAHGGSLYQEQLRVPLVIKPPRDADLDPRRLGQPVSLMDVAPTLCELARVFPSEAGFEGRSLLPLATGETPDPESWLLSELHRGKRRQFAVRHGAWKYVAHLEPEVTEELYQLEQDPGELVNRLDEADPGLVEELRAAVARHRELSEEHGFLFEVHGDGNPADIRIVVSCDSPMRGVELVRTEADGDEVVAVNPNHVPVRTLELHFQLDEDDRTDGAMVRPAGEDALTVSILVDDRPIEPERVLLGSAGEEPLRIPFDVRRADARLREGAEDLAPPEGSGAWCSVVYRSRAKTFLDPGLREGMRALGYAGAR